MGAGANAGRVNREVCARLDNKVDPAPPQTLPVKEGHTAAGVADSPRSVASCSTSDWVQEVPAQKHVFFSAAPAEVLQIVPYSEMYILHPRKFEFDSDGLYITDDESVDANLRSAVRIAQPHWPSGTSDQQVARSQKVQKQMHSACYMLPSKDPPRQIVISAGGLVSSALGWFEGVCIVLCCVVLFCVWCAVRGVWRVVCGVRCIFKARCETIVRVSTH